MATNHGLGIGNGGLTDHGNEVVEYRATGKLMPTFTVNVSNITGFAVRRPTKWTRRMAQAG